MKKMGKKFLIGTAMAVSSAAFLSACNRNTVEIDPSSGTTAAQESIASTEDPNVCVYGPPEVFESDSTDETFDESTEINEDVYGPPEYWEK